MMMKLLALLLVVLTVARTATAAGDVVQFLAGSPVDGCGDAEGTACQARAVNFVVDDVVKITYKIETAFANDACKSGAGGGSTACDTIDTSIFAKVEAGDPTLGVTVEVALGGAEILCPDICLDSAKTAFTGICQPGDGSDNKGCEYPETDPPTVITTAPLGLGLEAVATVECFSGPCAEEDTTPPPGEDTTPPTAEPTTPPTAEPTTPPTAEPTTPPSGEQTTPPPGGQTTPPPGEETTAAPEESAVVRCEAETEITSCGGTVDDPCQAYASATERKYAVGDKLKITYDIPAAFAAEGDVCNGADANVDCDVYSKVVYVVIAEGKPTAEGVDVAISESAAHVLCPQNCLDSKSEVFAGICQLGESDTDGCAYPDIADPVDGPRNHVCKAALGSGADATVSVECVSGTCYVWEGSAIALRTGVAALFASLLAVAMHVV